MYYLYYYLTILILFNYLYKFINGQCPTMGMTSYVLITITPYTEEDMFKQAIDYYGKMHSYCSDVNNIEIYFGHKLLRTVQSDDFDTLWDKNDVTDLYTSSLIQIPNNDTDINQLLYKLEDFMQNINNSNEQPLTVVKKKTITIITDYINENITNIIPDNLNKLNSQAYIISLNETINHYYSKYDRFTVCDTDIFNFDNCSNSFCSQIIIDLSNKVVQKPVKSIIYLASITKNLRILKSIATNVVNGQNCLLKPSEIITNYIKVHFLSTEYEKHIYLPWVGNITTVFYDHCINENLLNTLNISPTAGELKQKNPPDIISCIDPSFFYRNFINDLTNDTTLNTSVILYDDNLSECVKSEMFKLNTIIPELQIFISNLDNDDKVYIFENFINLIYYSIKNANSKININFINDESDINQTITICHNFLSQTNLTIAEKYHYLKPMNIALDQFIVIVILCTISAFGIGSFFYKLVKKKLEEENDIDDDYKSVKIYLKKENDSKVDLLPWQVHIDRIVINYEFPLGEGNSFVIYMGKLKGKAPVMQWINLGEMKQFQDCAVAIRVPRRYDYEEEQQLHREINAMKTLTYHDNIANLLGWVNKNNFSCTILELTHTNLSKYILQLKDGLDLCENENTVCLLPFKQFIKIITQITDAMNYIASKGLVHRDLAARNILLTTGLRAKISGFNFCSLVGDDNFEPTKPAFKYLPLHWMAIEAMTHGKFCENTDVWSFSMLLYEIYSLGEIPLGNIRDSVLLKTLKSGERPPHPTYATDEIYSIMCRSWQRYGERRPTFSELNTLFQSILERQYDNPAFEFENPS